MLNPTNSVKLILTTVLIINLSSCNSSTKAKELIIKEKELQLKEQELRIKIDQSQKREISTNDAISVAEKKFKQYLPKIEKSHDGVLDLMKSYTGDFTGDGIEDIAIYFSLSPAEGGNALVGQGLTLYQNTGTEVKVIAGFEPGYLFSFSRISNGRIYVEKLEYAEDDPRCCPSIKEEKELTISGRSVY